jgi:hypothetical protein
MSDKQEKDEDISEEIAEIKNQVLLEQEKLSSKKTAKKTCIVCGKPAEFCMRGIPENTNCKPCAKDYFKLLTYLDKL